MEHGTPVATGYVCMIGRKAWGLTGSQHDFALFRRILRSQPSSRPSRPSQARIVGESPKVDINQSAFVINGESISSDYRTWRRCGIRSLSSYQHPVRRGETGYRCGIDAGRARSRDQVMAVPTSKTDDTPIRRGSARTDTGSPACRRLRETLAGSNSGLASDR